MISFDKKIKILRVSEGSYKDGYYNEGEKSSFYINASVQPYTFREIDRQSFGREINDSIKIYSTELLTAKRDGNQADMVEYKGLLYEVSQVKDFTDYDFLPHYKTIAILFNEEKQDGH